MQEGVVSRGRVIWRIVHGEEYPRCSIKSSRYLTMASRAQRALQLKLKTFKLSTSQEKSLAHLLSIQYGIILSCSPHEIL